MVKSQLFSDGASTRPRKRFRGTDPQPREALPMNSRFLHKFAQRLFENLGDSTFDETFKLFAPEHCRWGSGCSGTESPEWMFSTLRDVICELTGSCNINFQHMYSAEWEERKRNWILSNASTDDPSINHLNQVQ